MNGRSGGFFLIFLWMAAIQGPLFAQPDSQSLKKVAGRLAGSAMQGRGYLYGGGQQAAKYIQRKFRKAGLMPLPGESNFFQYFTMGINTFPRQPVLAINGKKLRPGIDFMVHGASSPAAIRTRDIRTIDLSAVKDSLTWEKIRHSFNGQTPYLLRHADTVLKYRQLTIRRLANELPNGIFLFTLGNKLSWLASQDTVAATILYLSDSLLTDPVRELYLKINTRYISGFPNRNITGYVRGTAVPDSFIVFTAHYDHLGRMGKVLFPGANDNASGIAFLLSLANYYAQHPPHYSIAFMAFGGEEAGLVGSRFYAENPVFPLKQIRFLINMDMMGDATNGITVVNALANEREYALFNKLNKSFHYLPNVVARDQTKNSDHYPFSEKGVPAVYIYTNGVKPYYHDTRDTAAEVNFENASGVWYLLCDFLEAYMQHLP